MLYLFESKCLFQKKNIFELDILFLSLFFQHKHLPSVCCRDVTSLEFIELEPSSSLAGSSSSRAFELSSLLNFCSPGKKFRLKQGCHSFEAMDSTYSKYTGCGLENGTKFELQYLLIQGSYRALINTTQKISQFYIKQLQFGILLVSKFWQP